MKAVLTDERFSDPDWIFERKLDGIRCVAIRDGGATRMLSRNDLSLNGRYPLIAEALDGQARERFAVDGEVVSASGKFQDSLRPVLLLRLRRAVARRRGRARTAAARAQGAAAGGVVVGRPAAAHRVPQRGGRGDVRRGVLERLGGRDRQACGLRLHRQALPRLAQVQVRARPGAGRRRVHTAQGLARGVRRAARRRLRGRPRCTTPARSARASIARSWSGWPG